MRRSAGVGAVAEAGRAPDVSSGSGSDAPGIMGTAGCAPEIVGLRAGAALTRTLSLGGGPLGDGPGGSPVSCSDTGPTVADGRGAGVE
jgi:hypothetical protein